MSFVMPSPKFIIASFFIVFFIIVGPKYFLKRIYSVDGGYTEWSGWSLCMRDCGDSLQGNLFSLLEKNIPGYGYKNIIHCKVTDHSYFSNTSSV